MTHRFTSTVDRYEGTGAWYFATLPHDIADEIEESAPTANKDFGSVRVRVETGSSVWETSLFPSKKAATYVLPIKKAIRTAEDIDDGKTVEFTLSVV